MKKQFLTILLLLPAFLASHAQFDKDTVIAGWSSTWFVLNFDNPNPGLIEFDPPENNVWQIGKPQKEPFAPFTGTGAIMTDTSHMLDSALEHSFILKFHRLEESNAVREWIVDFKHIYQFDSLVSGGYISVSYDKGASWKNVVYDDYLYDDSTGCMALMGRLYDSTTIINNGQPALTGSGKTNGESVSDVTKFFSCTIWDAVWVYDIWVKFTYVNTGNNNPHAGWMIDYLDFSIDTWCEYLYDDVVENDNTGVQIYPNPVTGNSEILVKGLAEPASLTVYNSLGAVVLQREVPGENSAVKITRSELEPGIYLITLNQNGTTLQTLKMVVQ